MFSSHLLNQSLGMSVRAGWSTQHRTCGGRSCLRLSWVIRWMWTGFRCANWFGFWNNWGCRLQRWYTRFSCCRVGVVLQDVIHMSPPNSPIIKVNLARVWRGALYDGSRLPLLPWRVVACKDCVANSNFSEFSMLVIVHLHPYLLVGNMSGEVRSH